MKASKTGKPVHIPFSASFRKSVICTAVLCSMGLAHAEEVEVDKKKADEKEAIEVIEVSGILASSARNLSIKRLSNAMVDAITAEDIGKFPDKNVADSLQRVPGVVIQRSGGEGSTVSIRGLSSDLTFTQLNGNFIASSPGEPSRSFDYALLPSAMIQKVEVFKSPEARLDEGGVGGTVLLHTRKPFDMDANSGTFAIESTYADVTDDHEPQFTGVYSWKNDAETFGVLAGYTKQERTNRSLSGSANTWRWTGPSSTSADVNGQLVENTLTNASVVDARGRQYEGVWVPQFTRVGVFEETRDREGFQFTTQWRPTDNLELAFNYFGFKLGLDSTLSAIDMPEWSLTNGTVTNVSLDDSETIITGLDYSVGATGTEEMMHFPWVRGVYNREESTSDTFDFSGLYTGDYFQLKFVAGHTEAEGGPKERYEAAYYASNKDTGEAEIENAAQYSGWAIKDNKMTMYMDPNILTNLQAGIGGGVDPGSSNSSFVRSSLEEDYAQLDLDFDVELGIFHTIRAGAKYRNATLHRETRNTFYLSPDFDIAAGEASANGITRADSYQWNDGMPDAAAIMNFNPMGNIPGGFNINIMPSINWDRYASYLSDNFVKYTRREPNFIYDIEEKITSAYLQGDFQSDRYRGNLGVRVVKTDTTGASTDLFTFFKDYWDADGNQLSGDDYSEEEYILVSQNNSDTLVLPSFNIAYEASDKLVIRGAIAKVISRPDYSSLGSQERLTWISNEFASDRAEFNTIPGWSGSGGNKNLKPFEALQTDISFEYYYGEGSAVGIAFFNKDVDNFVVPLTIDTTRDIPSRTFEIAGQTVTAGGDNVPLENYSTSGNGSDATSRGVEVFIQHAFENGFGFYSNYTHNNTNKADVDVAGNKIGESGLIGSADFQFNFSGYFENEDFSVRASYNLRGDTLLGIANGMNVYADRYDQIDINASYNITDDLVATASVINLTESESFTHVGDDTTARYRSNSYSGRRIYAGISYSF
ncbi:TonB-dependent receptor [Thalassotalea insulae]|uniref:TonB-dependent receptor n=1 Tax=Thalassotalea insulae TaxID=2056778 RepID=A0ABQ6GPQ4_9GAMM|nr:TonB-dependent receptor [Thalassotalea insulae]GLX77362.1 TonB-dependent receptor [Thalassotalea insulae]